MSYESSTVRVPPPNLQGYAYLYSLESGLRELIIECLEPLGSKAYKQRLPGDVLDKYRKGREFELSIKWKSLIPHHPLYYVDFTDLRKIILRDDNWKELFKPIFSNKDLLRAKMSEELDLVRNKIAHNRKISKSDLILIELTYSHIVDLVGKDRFEALATKCTDAPDLRERLIRLREFAEVSLERCWLVKPISDMTVWESTVGEWWFDDSFLGHSVADIEKYFSIVLAYGEIPRLRGTGYAIENWVKSSTIHEAYARASAEFQSLLDV